MTYHIRPAIKSKADFRAFAKDVGAKGKAFMRYEDFDISLNFFLPAYAVFEGRKLVIEDVSSALKNGKVSDTYSLETSSAEALDVLHGYMAACSYNMKDFFDWCDSLGVDHDASDCRYIGVNRQIAVFKSRKKGIKTFSPLALSHLNPLKELPKRWTISHVRRLLAAGQYSYCGIEQRYTSDFVHDLSNNFGERPCTGESFLKHLTEQPTGWWVRECSEPVSDGDELYVYCHSFEARVIKLDLGASRNILNASENVAGRTHAGRIPAPGLVGGASRLQDQAC